MLNTYKLAYIGFEISTVKLTRIHWKTLYMSKDKVRLLRLWSLARTITPVIPSRTPQDFPHYCHLENPKWTSSFKVQVSALYSSMDWTKLRYTRTFVSLLMSLAFQILSSLDSALHLQQYQFSEQCLCHKKRHCKLCHRDIRTCRLGLVRHCRAWYALLPTSHTLPESEIMGLSFGVHFTILLSLR